MRALRRGVKLKRNYYGILSEGMEQNTREVLVGPLCSVWV